MRRWVFNTLLNEAATTGHPVFDPTKSSTFAPSEGFTFNITYGDTSFARGGVGTDTVDIGGATVTKQAIGLPSEISDSFKTDQKSDGLVGLGFTSLNTMRPRQQKTFFDNVSGDLDEPVLTAQLKHGGVGSYEFGRIDPAKFRGTMANISVDNSRGFWEFKSTMFSIGNASKIQTVAQGASSAIADTGTTLMLINTEIVEAYYAQVTGARFSDGAQGFIFPCDATLPDLFVSVGDTHLAKIPGSLANFAVVGRDTVSKSSCELYKTHLSIIISNHPYKLYSRSILLGNALLTDSLFLVVCFGGIQSNRGTSLQIYGDVFFKAIFVAFDLRGPSLGMAAHA